MNKNIAIVQGKNILVTCSQWFFAPDGRTYRAAWGKVAIHQDVDIMGIKTNSKSANWYAFVGDNDKGVLIAGCQIHYAVVCDELPNTDNIHERRQIDATLESKIVERETCIYIAQ